MTTQTISGAYPTGFTLASKYNGLYINQSASVGGSGILVSADASVFNHGGLVTSNNIGVDLIQGGSVTNEDAGTITGVQGVASALAATVANYGEISGNEFGVDLAAGGSVYNGGNFFGGYVRSASVSGQVAAVYITGGAGTVGNAGTLGGEAIGGTATATGIVLNTGSVTNYAGALIDANTGVKALGAATIGNYGVISYTYNGIFETTQGYGALGVELTAGGVFRNETGAQVKAATGVQASAGAVYNTGTIEATGQTDSYAGVRLLDGASLRNGAMTLHATGLIEGIVGVYGGTGGVSVSNFGSILGRQDGVDLSAGGGLVNGSSALNDAVIEGSDSVYAKGGASIVNFGTLESTSPYALTGYGDLQSGGKLTNGSGGDTTALIEGSVGAKLEAGAKVSNYGVIDSLGPAAGVYGVLFTAGGSLANGSAGSRKALIEGYGGVEIQGAAGSVSNFGTITATGAGAQYGARLAVGGTLTNGASNVATALIQGNGGIALGAKASVSNFGTVRGYDGVGVEAQGGVITNGGGVDRAALIEGLDGVAAYAAETVKNFGSILANGALSTYGVMLAAGGSLSNGSVSNASALIEGYGGVDLASGALGFNFGVISGEGDAGGAGVVLGAGAELVNGQGGHAGAVIEGYIGVLMTGGQYEVLANYGTIIGLGGVAVQLASSQEVLQVAAGSSFVGLVEGAGGVLDLITGTGTLTGLLAGGNVTVAGSMAATTFHDFGAVDVGAAASFTAVGNGAIAAGQSLIDDGTLTTAGTISVAGTLSTNGLLAGTGALAVAGGLAEFAAGTSLTLAKVSVSGAAAVNVTTSLIYAGVWTQSAGTLSVATGDKLTFTGTGNSFTGTLAGPGSLAISGGSDTLSGAISLSANLSVTTPNLIVAAGGATISGTGELVLSNTVTNSLHGASAAATLTDNGKIFGAGAIGGGVMTLIIGSTGFVDGNQALALTINTGTNTIANAGTIYGAGAGGTIVDSAVANTGKLYADGGTLTLEGAVTGAGIGYINGGTLEAASTFSENVTFIGTTGVLELANSQAYGGTITGFSLTGATSLDLRDITFGASTKASYSGTSTSGTLTITDGTHTSRIKLSGNYTASSFDVSSDGHGGTTVIDPPRAARGHAFIAAMAGFGAPGGTASAAAEPWRAPAASLAPPNAV